MIPQHVTDAINAADYTIGSDESGYGSYAGNMVVCAVVLSKDWPLTHLVKDSKSFQGKTARARRDAVAKQILASLTYAIVSNTPAEIDERGVWKVLHAAHTKAIDAVIAKHKAMGVIGTYAVIVDGNMKIPYGNGQQALSLPKADALIPAVSAASILGKVAHDHHMDKMAVKFPGYGFESNSGYGGNAAHDEGLKKLGVCEIHRKSYGPIAKLIEETEKHVSLEDFSDD
jgi:ribonuclease HII